MILDLNSIALSVWAEQKPVENEINLKWIELREKKKLEKKQVFDQQYDHTI